MTHYVCTGGCKGVSNDAGTVCKAEDCPRHDHPLTPCDCEDKGHREAFAKNEA